MSVAMPCPRSLYAPNAPLADLRTAELLLVAALRQWVAPYRNPGAAPPDWRGGFMAGGVDPAGIAAFDGLFRIVAATPRRPLDVRCPRCATLGADEAWLLQLVGLLQRGRNEEGGQILGDWLPPAAVRVALPVARTLAVALAVGGLMVPHRHAEAGLVGRNGPTLVDRGVALVH